MQKKDKNIPLSESSVTLRLADIQKRCSDFADGNDELSELTLEEAPAPVEGSNPYDRS